MNSSRLPMLASVLLVVCVLSVAALGQAVQNPSMVRQIIVPGEDRFTPFAITIRVGQTVEWVNNDTDDHTIVSNDAFNTEGHHGLDHLIPGTDNNGGKPGTFSMTFNTPGNFVYYCRFHSHLDAHHQPTAPGPDGGIQADDGNFGTPMMGVITVLP